MHDDAFVTGGEVNSALARCTAALEEMEKIGSELRALMARLNGRDALPQGNTSLAEELHLRAAGFRGAMPWCRRDV